MLWFGKTVAICLGTLVWLWRVPNDVSAQPSTSNPTRPQPEAISLLGKPLYPLNFPEERRRQLEAELAAALRAYEANPDDVERLIWLGRRTAYLTRYREAIAIYTRGLEKHPDHPKLLRHRGHRYISVREFDRAIADLRRAAELTRDSEDEIEPDGQPNAYNRPRSTLKGNIWYHLGLAYYLKGDFQNALQAFRECMTYATWNDDMLVATSDWLYMTYRRLGRVREAEQVLAPIRKEMEILENHSYHRRLLMYQGLLSSEELLDLENGDDLEIATQGYGVGNWYLYHGQPEKARKIFERVVAGGYWPAFGYLAAEADLARMSDRRSPD